MVGRAIGAAAVLPVPDAKHAADDLLTRARAGDESVWARWYDDYYALLHRYAFARLGSREEAEDTAAQVFLEALRGIDRYEPGDRPILAWLYGIARNLVANRARKRAREESARSRLPRPLPVDSTADVINDADLSRAFAKLTAEQAEVLTLRFKLDLPTREVAALVGKGEAAVYSLQVRAIAALRRSLVA